MNWLHFITWVAGLYLSYYLVNILLDVAGSKRSPADKSLTNELTFSEEVQTQRLIHEPEKESPKSNPIVNTKTDRKNQAKPEVMASGGVSLKDLFNLARQESIIYTRPVSF